MTDPLKINTTALAFVGDSAYETRIRMHLLEAGEQRPDRLHRAAVKYVCAGAQAKIIRALMDELTE